MLRVTSNLSGSMVFDDIESPDKLDNYQEDNHSSYNL